MKKSTLLHLRIPFSYFLLPVFLFAWAIFPRVDFLNLTVVFIILHLFVYPASNGYNSYFDKDEDSIGGLKHPPKVTKELYNVSLFFDVVGLVLGFFLSVEFVLMIFVYGGISKAYSHPSTRLKKYPYYGWLAAGVFQGYFTFITCLAGFGLDLTQIWEWQYQIPAILSSMLLFGSYPMTQVYQHKEDAERGDITISLKLGILGTFHFSAIFFFVSVNCFLLFFSNYHSLSLGLAFLAQLTPVLLYFGYWYLQVRKDTNNADFDRTMKLNMISASCFNAFFLMWIFLF